MKIIVDGNDGTGKSTLVEILKHMGYENVLDRGVTTKMTDNLDLLPSDNDFYIILDAPVEISHNRLRFCGKPMNEYYHTIDGLTYYRNQYKKVASKLGNKCIVIDASKPILEVVVEVSNIIESMM